MLSWVRQRKQYGPPVMYLYAGKNKVGHVTKNLSNDFIAKTHLPMGDRDDCIVFKGGEKQCMDGLSHYTRRWFYECGYVIDINAKVENPYVP